MAHLFRLKRLLHLRVLREEQKRAALHLATEELRALTNSLELAQAQNRSGITLFAAGAASPDPVDRVAGLCERQIATSRVHQLADEIAAARASLNRQHADLLEAHCARRQSELLIEAVENDQEEAEAKKSQRELDDAHGSRLLRKPESQRIDTGPSKG